jgi:hypothetical protein
MRLFTFAISLVFGAALHGAPFTLTRAEYRDRVEAALRLYQRVLIPVKLPGNAYWKEIRLP